MLTHIPHRGMSVEDLLKNKVCPVCGESFKRLDVHMRKAHPEEAGQPLQVDEYIADKRLSSLLSDMRQLLMQYRSAIEIKVAERNGKPESVEIVARIQIR